MEMAMTLHPLPCGGWSKQLAVSVHTLYPKVRTRPLKLQISAQSEFSMPPPYGPQVAEAVKALRPTFEDVDTLVATNLNRVIKAYANARVGSHHFAGTTGYGHNDAGGRDALDQAFAEIMGAEAAIVRSQVGSPLMDSSGRSPGVASAGEGSLKEFGVSYREVPLSEDGGINWDALNTAVKPETQCALIQRSCGYSWRKTLTVAEIQRAIRLIKGHNPNCIIVVDNCYGEFVETIEPTAVGADLMAGSLIKNPGGTIAPCGGYVAGSSKWVQAAAARLCAPGIGMSAGSTTGDVMRLLFQGLFLAPQMVGEAIKGTLLVAEVMAAEGYNCQPAPRVRRYDVIQAVQLGDRERLLSFCRAAQRICPVGSYIQPVAGATAGYESEVVFADGTFIDGSTSELSCDGPLREPYVVFCQGGTHWTHWALALEGVVQALRQLN
ncbi:hypothetical protein R1flu_019626 [Riccia fluitans]|uniref:Aluminum resistance protein n=1 Tax=Riccia fluitans TaxID=41844 RepID=A0ABD1ZJD8_9MARC